MAKGTFTIEEKGGGGYFGSQKFVWTSDRTTPFAASGDAGARAAPLRPWPISGSMRTVRTDYPGAKRPTEQVLGPMYNNFTLQGKWDDRYNVAGFAVATMQNFEAMARRGNICRFQFESIVLEGIITDWEFEYHREWDIKYSFTVSVHHNPEEVDYAFVPPTLLSAGQLLDNTALIVAAAIASMNTAPVGSMSLPGITGILDLVNSLADQMESLNNSLSFRELGRDIRSGITPFRRLATQFRALQGVASNIAVECAAFRSDVELTTRTAASVLDFESFVRDLAFWARLVMGTSSKAARQMETYDEPDAIRLYRPHEGESLYRVSRQFYGTPHAWRTIADRNGITGMTLTGDEVLIIPERA